MKRVAVAVCVAVLVSLAASAPGAETAASPRDIAAKFVEAVSKGSFPEAARDKVLGMWAEQKKATDVDPEFTHEREHVTHIREVWYVVNNSLPICEQRSRDDRERRVLRPADMDRTFESLTTVDNELIQCYLRKSCKIDVTSAYHVGLTVAMSRQANTPATFAPPQKNSNPATFWMSTFALALRNSPSESSSVVSNTNEENVVNAPMNPTRMTRLNSLSSVKCTCATVQMRPNSPHPIMLTTIVDQGSANPGHRWMAPHIPNRHNVPIAPASATHRIFWTTGIA